MLNPYLKILLLAALAAGPCLGQTTADTAGVSYLDYNGSLVTWPGSNRPAFRATVETIRDEENSYENLMLRGSGRTFQTVPAEGFVSAVPGSRYSILFQHQIITDSFWGLSYFSKGIFGGEFSDDVVRGYLKSLMLRKPPKTTVTVLTGPDESDYNVDFPVLGAYGKRVIYEVANEEEKTVYRRMEFFCPLADGTLVVLTYQNHPGRFDSMFPIVRESLARMVMAR